MNGFCNFGPAVAGSAGPVPTPLSNGLIVDIVTNLSPPIASVISTIGLSTSINVSMTLISTAIYSENVTLFLCFFLSLST